MATHLVTNTWKMDWKTSYLKLIEILLQVDNWDVKKLVLESVCLIQRWKWVMNYYFI